MVLVGVVAIAVARVGVEAIEASRAQAAADAAALAGVTGGRGQAVALAEANGAAVVGWNEEGDDVRVDVALGRARASAQAHRTTAAGPAVAPAMRAVLARAAQLLGGPVAVVGVDAGGLVVEIAESDRPRVSAGGAAAGLCAVAGRTGWFEICPMGT